MLARASLTDLQNQNPFTNEIRGATGGESALYSEEFREKAPTYHRTGLGWDNKALGKFFSEGLLQYYVGIISGYDFRYRGSRTEKSNSATKCGVEGIYDAVKFYIMCDGGITSPKQIDQLKKWKQQDIAGGRCYHWVEPIAKMFDKLKENKELLELGATFQKVKLQAEKLSLSPTTEIDPKEKSAKLIALNKQLDLMQSYIYWWIIDFYHQVSAFILSKDCDIGWVSENLEDNAQYPFEPKNPEFIADLDKKLKAIDQKLQDQLAELAPEEKPSIIANQSSNSNAPQLTAILTSPESKEEVSFAKTEIPADGNHGVECPAPELKIQDQQETPTEAQISVANALKEQAILYKSHVLGKEKYNNVIALLNQIIHLTRNDNNKINFEELIKVAKSLKVALQDVGAGTSGFFNRNKNKNNMLSAVKSFLNSNLAKEGYTPAPKR